MEGLSPLNVPQTINQDRKGELCRTTPTKAPFEVLAVVTNVPCTRKDSRPCTLYNPDLAPLSAIATADVGLLWERAEKGPRFLKFFGVIFRGRLSRHFGVDTRGRMSAANLHKKLRLGDPTPEQQRLYGAVDVHGYLDDQPDEGRFLAAFVLGLYQTYDRKANIFQTAALIIPNSLDKWVVDQINATLDRIKKDQETWRPDVRLAFNQHLVAAVRHLEMGSRVFQIKPPSRWVAFGFGDETPAPDWVKNGLLP